MTTTPKIVELKPRITVIGVGGGGGNAVNNMIAQNLEGAEFVVANTDAQALAMSKASRLIQLGANTTEGLGAGTLPEVGRTAADESIDEIMDHLAGTHMCFRDRWHGRRNWNRGRACHCPSRAPGRHSHRGRRHQAVRLRGPPRRCSKSTKLQPAFEKKSIWTPTSSSAPYTMTRSTENSEYPSLLPGFGRRPR